jgi:two-component sensor histidine kinase
MRLLAGAYRLSSHLGEAESAERDPDQLQRLFHIDHAVTQIRRQAENLHVLTGMRIDDAGRQITTLLDVIRAAASAIEQYRRVQIGHVAELAVAEHAADDVIRILTELVDNATRYSPPASPVTVSAHLTEHGTVLLRVEDTGVGVPPDRLPYLNAMLAGDAEPGAGPDTAAQLGLVVVRRLAETNGLRVHLTPRQPVGTTAALLLPGPVLCEVPGPPPAPARAYAAVRPPHRPAVAPVRPLAPAAPRHLAGPPAAGAPLRAVHARPAGGPGGGGGLPRRVPESLRGTEPAPALPGPPATSRLAEDVGAFADGLADAERALAATPTEGIR